MLRSWCASSRALATLAAVLLPTSLALAVEPALFWPQPPRGDGSIVQAQCTNGMCPQYVQPEYSPALVYADGTEGEYVIEQPGCDAVYGCDDGIYGCGDMVGECGDECYSACDCCCPLWTARGEALFWARTGGGGVPLVAAPVAVNSDDFDLGWQVGPRVSLTRHGIWDTCWDLEGAYFGIDNWSDTIALVDMDDYQTTPAIIIPGVTPGTLVYDSFLHSGEVNLRRVRGDWITWLVGFRWIEVGENLNATFGAASHNVMVNNQLFGGQLGLDTKLWDNGANLSITGVGKAGVFGNSASQVTTTAGVGGALPLIAATGGQASFVGELGINGRYRLTDRWTATGGYNFLWITGVALAPNQLATTDVTTGVATVDAGGTLFYHGANAGLEFVW